jgi:hypothetical protein
MTRRNERTHCRQVVTARIVNRRRIRITGGQYGIQSFDGARNLLVRDTEIDGSAHPGAIGSKGIAGANFTVPRCHIHHAGSDGVQTFGSNIIVRQCFIHDCGYGGYNAADPTNSDHTDGIQVFGGSHILIEYNTVINRHGGTRDDGVSTGYPLQSQVSPYGTANAAVVIQSDSDTGGAIDDFQVSNNWLDGGIFTLRLEEKDGNEMTNGRVFGNRFGRDYYFGPAYMLGTPSYTASDNLFDATGTPISGL